MTVEWPEDFREQFWKLYPRRVGKIGALKKLEQIKRSGVVDFADILAAVANYAAACTDLHFCKHPETWLSKGCWEDEVSHIRPCSVKEYHQQESDNARAKLKQFIAAGSRTGRNEPGGQNGGHALRLVPQHEDE
jgi:hypothetical protein